MSNNVHHAPFNLNSPLRYVKHSELQRYCSSPYRSRCPVCNEGVLFVGRDQITFQLLESDRCILCAQQFVYTDIEELRKSDPLRNPTT